MSKPVAVVTDSTASLPADLVEKYHIHVVPLRVVWDGVAYRDGVDMTPEAFYRRLAESKTLPTSSQPSAQDFVDVFRPLLDEGYDVLTVVISSKMSGTMSSAQQAKEMLGADNIEIVDSLSTGMETGFHALLAARAAAEGASLAECKAIAEKAREHSGFLLMVPTLEFLHRGGRIGGASRWFGTMLRIKPILEVRGGRVEPLEKVRARRKALQRMADITVERVGDSKPVRLAVVHTGAEEDARQLLAQLSERLDPVETLIGDVSPVVGVHVGPNGVGVVYVAGM
ncbi:MAG: DegV family protein [Chloroflexi bacterium]|nr:DegV family protein [Chloroflexota bacterium]